MAESDRARTWEWKPLPWPVPFLRARDRLRMLPVQSPQGAVN